MAVTLKKITAHEDGGGNRIEYSGTEPMDIGITVLFRGPNNVLTVDSAARTQRIYPRFDSHNGRCQIGANSGVAALKAGSRVGQDSAVLLGDNVSTTPNVDVSAVEEPPSRSATTL